MKFLVIGLGSMGKRRIGCLKELGYEDIVGYDIKEERVLSVDIQTFTDFGLIMFEKPDVFLICTPPDHHLSYQSFGIAHGIPCFTEASVCLEGLEKLDNSSLIYPSATMRFNKEIKIIKRNIEYEGNPAYFDYYCSSYLPDWHPNEDISDFYVSKKKTGACREIVPFELEWLVWCFGKVRTLKSIIKNTTLFGEIDDIYEILIEFESGTIGHVRIDIISPYAKGGKREFIMVKGSNFFQRTIIPTEQMYVNEMSHFIESLDTDIEYHYSLEEDIKILKLLEEIENDNSNNTCPCGK